MRKLPGQPPATAFPAPHFRQGGAGPVRRLLGGKDLTGPLSMPRHGFPAAATSLLPCNDHASAITEVAEHVVVAGGGAVGEDGRHQVGACEPSRREVEAAALAQAAAAAVPRGATVGPVERDEAMEEREARRALGGGPAVEDTAALAVAAVAANAAGAAGGRVQDDRRVGESADRPVHVLEAAPLARP